MKETYYFPHDYDPTGDPKMQALLGEFGGCGYGVFWRIIEMLHSDSTHKLPLKQYIYLAIAKQMLTNAEQIQAIINYCINPCELFISDADYFWSNRVNSNFEKRSQISEVRSLAGKAGAIAKQKLAKSSKGKEKKGKEKEEQYIEFSVFWDLYNHKVGNKLGAEKKWNKLSASEQLKIIDVLPAYLKIIKDKQFQAHADTWLNQRRWENEDLIQNKIVPQKAVEKVYRDGDLIPNPDWVEPQRTRND